METMPPPKPALPAHRRGSLAGMIVVFVIGVAIGCAISWPLFLGDLNRARPAVDTAIPIVAGVLAALGVGLLVLLPVALFGLWRFFRRTDASLNTVTTEIIAAARFAAEQNPAQAAQHLEHAASGAIAWYSPIAARRAALRGALALLVALGGIVGTALLFRQTILLDAQNDKLDMQAAIAQAQLRAVLAQQWLAIEEKISTLSEEHQKNPPPPKPGEAPPKLVLPPWLLARIVAFSHAAEPYLTVELRS